MTWSVSAKTISCEMNELHYPKWQITVDIRTYLVSSCEILQLRNENIVKVGGFGERGSSAIDFLHCLRSGKTQLIRS